MTARRRWFRIGPRLRAALALLWLVPPAAVGGMWARSHFVADEVSAVDEESVQRAAVSYQGAVHLLRSEGSAMPRGPEWDEHRVPPGATWANFYTAGVLQWEVGGLAKVTSMPPAPLAGGPGGPVTGPATAASPARRQMIMAGAAPGGAGMVGVPAGPFGPPVTFRHQLAPWLWGVRWKAYTVPYWPVFLVTLWPAVRMVWVRGRRWTRRRRGLCGGCGYDVRGGSERCPECGEPVPARVT